MNTFLLKSCAGASAAMLLAGSAAAQEFPRARAAFEGLATADEGLQPLMMFDKADPVVKSIMALLLLCSLVSVVIWVGKNIELIVARLQLARQLQRLRRFATLDEAVLALPKSRSPLALMLREVEHERQISRRVAPEAGSATGLKERTALLLSRLEARAGRRANRGTGILATIGSTTPFVGLLGTVWGIMNSFIGIAESNTTNLAVVAPGISEALLATAIGLFAAIPAVVFYNQLARAVQASRALHQDAAAFVQRTLSRSLDQQTPEGA